jgi:hypothetical protein
VEAFDKAIELFNKKSDQKEADGDLPEPQEDAFVTEIPIPESTTTTTSSVTGAELSTTRFTEKVSDKSLPIKEKNEIPRV